MSTPSGGITPRATDFNDWYQDVIAAADLAEHSDVKGAMIFKPYGYAMWERIQSVLDQRIKATGHQNVYFPLFIPKSYFSREAEHVEGFAKETAVVTHHRLMADPNGNGLVVDPQAKLPEELIVRPTSETVIHSAFARWIKSWRDLPVLINQWANVVRMELRPRMFIRPTEFLWQEGHTAHATEEEAEAEARKMLGEYVDFVEGYLAVPLVAGQKSESEKFAGALRTYTIEALMQDGKALQAGTSHNLGQGFAKAFNVQFLDANNQLQYTWMTSWGVSIRLIGACIMTHSDDKGLVLPPKIAPDQVVIVPIGKESDQRTAANAAAETLAAALREKEIRVVVDTRDHLSLGEKLYGWEKKGVPIRVEIGPRDLADGNAVIVRRDTGEKTALALTDTADRVSGLLATIQTDMLAVATKRLADQTRVVASYQEFKDQIEQGGFFRALWCEDADCEARMKDETKATIRCLPFDQSGKEGTCFACGKPAVKEAIVARAY